MYSKFGTEIQQNSYLQTLILRTLKRHLTVYVVQRQMGGAKDKFERMWKEAIMAYLSYYFAIFLVTEKNHNKSQPG
jgi:hypothetical protein